MQNLCSNYMVYSGVHFKTCPIEIREAWSVIENAEVVNTCIYKVTNQNLEFVNLGTCNRFDICIFGKVTSKQIQEIFYNLALTYFISYNLIEFINNPNKIMDYIKISIDADALHRLFNVTASLDSLVLGEQQILGQVKEAYLKCTALGFARKTANQVFSHNFRVAKKIRTETEIGKNSVSVGHAATAMILQVFDSLQDKKILLIGAGDMAKLIAKNFQTYQVKSLFIANRTFGKAEKLASELGFAFPLELSQALQQIHEYDICVVAASGNNFIITKDILKNYEKKRKGSLSVFIDVSVPRKITPEANNMDNVFLFYIDDLDSIMEQNRSLRKKSAKEAELIIAREVQAYTALCEQKENLQNVAKMHNWLRQIINYEVERYLYDVARGKSTNPNIIADAVAKRVVSHTALLSRDNLKLDKPENSVGEMLEFLFNLSSQSLLEFTKDKQKENVIPLKIKRNN